MQFNLELNPESYSIRSYNTEYVIIRLPRYMGQDSGSSNNAGQFTQESFNRTLVLTPHQLIRDWPPQAIDEINSDHLDTLTGLQPDIVLLGTGPQLRWPETGLVELLLNRGIGVEIMDTGAACRTYNILMSEHRRVVAALLFR